jgi:hypothetical protein
MVRLVALACWAARGKDAGSADRGPIGATEDAASGRPARRGDTVLTVRQAPNRW